VPLRLFIGGALASARRSRSRINFVLHDYQRNRDPRSSSIPRAIRSAPAIISASRRSRSDRAASSARASCNGTQSHLDYLPEGHTDFALATMMEEWG
jgi:rod shape determining protein RodA